MAEQRVIVYVDGGMLGHRNPSPEGVHWSVWCAGCGERVVAREQSGAYHTNNEAEWLALQAGIAHLLRHHGRAPGTVRSDSRLIVNGFTGRWHMGNLRMRRLQLLCRESAEAIPQFVVEWRPRAELVKRVGH